MVYFRFDNSDTEWKKKNYKYGSNYNKSTKGREWKATIGALQISKEIGLRKERIVTVTHDCDETWVVIRRHEDYSRQKHGRDIPRNAQNIQAFLRVFWFENWVGENRLWIDCTYLLEEGY